MKVAAEKATAEGKEPLLPPVDTKLSFSAMKTKHAILYCIGEIELSPAECIGVEVEIATRLLGRPDIARENLAEVAAAVQLLSPWFEQFTELYEAKICRNEVTLGIPGVPLAATEVESSKSPPTSSQEITDRSARPSSLKIHEYMVQVGATRFTYVLSPMHQALYRSFGTTLDSLHGERRAADHSANIGSSVG